MIPTSATLSRTVRAMVALALAWLGSTSTALAAADATRAACEVRSSDKPPLAVVELYTSEGCSSCPPADRWLSALRSRDDVLALGFHVDYWDRLGWRDRFATPATTQRQHDVQRALGTPYVYTPQVVLNGRDLRAWSSTRLDAMPAGAFDVHLVRDGTRFTATVRAMSSAVARPGVPNPAQLAGYWVVLEDGHVSRVRTGENAGETLRHDHVVVHYEPVPGRPLRRDDAASFTIDVQPSAQAPARRVAFVLTDARSANPVAAAVLRC
jgi:hypothetical protein